MITPADINRVRTSFRWLVRRFSVSERSDVECCGMTVAQGATLEALRRGGVMRSAHLGERLGVTPSTFSRNLARLERRGMVERIPDPDDGRVFMIALTRSGRLAAERLEAIEDAFAERVLERLTPERRKRALDGMNDLVEAVREETEGCCLGAYDHLIQEVVS